MSNFQYFFQVVGVFLFGVVLLYLVLAWSLFSWVKNEHPQHIPNPKGSFVELSNVGFLFLILSPKRGALKFFPEKKLTIYSLRALFAIFSLAFILVFLLIAFF